MSIQARLFSCPFWIFDLLSLKNSKSIIIYRTFDLLPERHLIYIVHPFSKSAHHDNESLGANLYLYTIEQTCYMNNTSHPTIYSIVTAIDSDAAARTE